MSEDYYIISSIAVIWFKYSYLMKITYTKLHGLTLHFLLNIIDVFVHWYILTQLMHGLMIPALLI